MYILKYPEETPPENAESYYVESLSKTAYGYTLDINVIGVDGDDKYYGVTPEKGKSKITVSASAAQKYTLKKGDKLILTCNRGNGLIVFEKMNALRHISKKQGNCPKLKLRRHRTMTIFLAVDTKI